MSNGPLSIRAHRRGKFKIARPRSPWAGAADNRNKPARPALASWEEHKPPCLPSLPCPALHMTPGFLSPTNVHTDEAPALSSPDLLLLNASANPIGVAPAWIAPAWAAPTRIAPRRSTRHAYANTSGDSRSPAPTTSAPATVPACTSPSGCTEAATSPSGGVEAASTDASVEATSTDASTAHPAARGGIGGYESSPDQRDSQCNHQFSEHERHSSSELAKVLINAGRDEFDPPDSRLYARAPGLKIL